MITLTKLITSLPSHQMTSNVQEQIIEDKLSAIYGEPSALYDEQKQNFDCCKKQLIELLEYIYNLDPAKLTLFSIYRQNVENKLLIQSTENDKKITLKFAKESLEQNLLTLEQNLPNVKKSDLDASVVNLCFSGASSGIETTLRLFNNSSMELLVYNAKYNLLQQQALMFFRTMMRDMPGSEIHYANALVNQIAPIWGVKKIPDHLAPDDIARYSQAFLHYLKPRFNPASFLLSLKQSLFPPKEVNNADDFEQLEHFFNIFGMKIERERYLPFYTEAWDDNDNLKLIPKENFDLLVDCFLVEHLQMQHYFDNTLISLDEITLVFSTEKFLKKNTMQTDDEYRTNYVSYQELTDDELFSILLALRKPEYKDINQVAGRIILGQLGTETISNIYLEKNIQHFTVHEKAFLAHIYKIPQNKIILMSCFFSILLQRKQTNLSTELWERLIADVFANKEWVKPQDIRDIFQIANTDRNYDLVISLLPLIEEKNLKDYLGNALFRSIAEEAVKIGYADVLLTLHRLQVNLNFNNTEQYKSLALLATQHKQKDILRVLHTLGINLNQQYRFISQHGTWIHTPLLSAVRSEDIEMIELLLELGVDINSHICDEIPSMTDWAIRNNNLRMLNELVKRGANLDLKFYPELNIDTLISWALNTDNLKMMIIIKESGIDFTSEKDALSGVRLMGRAAVLGAVNIIRYLHSQGVALDKMPKGIQKTAIHTASEALRIDVLDALAALISSDHKDTPHLIVDDLKAKFNLREKVLGRTAVFLAITSQQGHHHNPENFNKMIATIEKLCHLGTDINAKDKHGNTLAHFVVNCRWLNLSKKMLLLKKLIELKADFNIENNNNKKPIDLIPSNSKKLKEVLDEQFREVQENPSEILQVSNELRETGKRSQSFNPGSLFFFQPAPKVARRDEKTTDEHNTVLSPRQ